MAALVRQRLTEAGYAVAVAETGEAALAWIDLGHHDVIVLDDMLPGIDGLERCRRLRRWQVPAPILLLTAVERNRPRTVRSAAAPEAMRFAPVWTMMPTLQ